MKKLKTLKKFTVPKIVAKSKTIRSKLQNRNPRKIDDVKGTIFGFSSKDEGEGSGRYHKQLIWFPSTKVNVKNYLSLPVKVYCSCEFFNYYLAYALHKNKNLLPRKALQFAMTNPAKKTNPTNRTYLCKHLFNASKLIGKRKMIASTLVANNIINLISSVEVVDISKSYGSIEGYKVNSSETQIENFLARHKIRNPNFVKKIRAKYEKIAIMNNLWVDEEKRSKGKGSQLVEDFIDDCSDCDAIILLADEDEIQLGDFSLQEFYKNFGFETAFKTSSGPIMVLENGI